MTMKLLKKKKPKKKTTKISPAPSTKPLKEEEIQIALVHWLASIEKTNPSLEYWATLNERKATSYYMDKLKRMGLKAGITDLFLEWDDKDGYINVLYLELKIGKHKNAKKQGMNENEIKFKEKTAKRVTKYRNYAVAFSCNEARAIISKLMRI